MEKFYVQEDGFAKQAYDDFNGTMEKIAKMGYAGIEIYYGLHGGYKPAELKAFMESIGMEIVGSHVDLENTDAQLDYLPGTGCRYIICPGIHVETLDEAYKAAELLNENGRKAKAVGMKYGIHNHTNDFAVLDGKLVNDVLIENTDPDLVTFEIDVAWAWRAGYNAAEYIRKHPGRFELVHVKETTEIKDPNMFKMPPRSKMPVKLARTPWGLPDMPPEVTSKFAGMLSINCRLGAGIINMPDIKAACDAQGIETRYVVERDYAWTGDIFTTLAHDAGYLSCL